jgi:hypothetical protein
VISAGSITIDPEKREARVHGDLLILTADEFDLLAVLAAEPYRDWKYVELLDQHSHLPGYGWLRWAARRLAEKLSRVGVEHDLARADGLYRLCKLEMGGES